MRPYSICGEPLEFVSAEALLLCGICRRVPPNFDFAISFGAYDGTLSRLPHLFKYEQLRLAAKVSGPKMADAIGLRNFASKQPVLAIPVPLHGTKCRQRGFNQSELIVRGGLKHLDGSQFELHTGSLRRVRATRLQTGLKRCQRLEDVLPAFVVTTSEPIRDGSVPMLGGIARTRVSAQPAALTQPKYEEDSIALERAVAG